MNTTMLLEAFHGLRLDCCHKSLERSGTERVGTALFMERLAPDRVGAAVALERLARTVFHKTGLWNGTARVGTAIP